MLTKGIIDEDFVNYKVPAMFINSCSCTFKCDKESGIAVCQNSPLKNVPTYRINDDMLVMRFKSNPITKAIVIGGLEPFDTFMDLLYFVYCLNRYSIENDLVIYTGYNEDEIASDVYLLEELCHEERNLIIKYGRYIPNKNNVFDENLGIYLASDNQYSVVYPKDW